MNDMKIIILVDSCESGGAGVVVNRLTDAFRNNYGYDVLRVAVYQYCDVPYRNGVIFFRNKNNTADNDSVLKIIRNIRKLISSEKPDAVISFSTPINIDAIICKLFLPYKLIISERSNPYIAPTNKRQRLMRKIFYSKANMLVCQTQSSKKFFSKKINKTIIENPVPDNLPKLCEKPDNVIVSVGRLIESKNFPMLINVFERLSRDYAELCLYIYGDGSQRGVLEDLIKQKKMQGKIFFQGAKENVLEYVSKAKVFAFPSEYEGSSNALLEAVALGVPVVTTDHPTADVDRLVTNESTGIIVPVGDENAFYKGMKTVLDNYEFYKKNALQNAITCRAKYSIGNISGQWDNLIRNIINNEF